MSTPKVKLLNNISEFVRILQVNSNRFILNSIYNVLSLS